MNNLDARASCVLLAVTWQNKLHLEFLESTASNMGDAAGNKTWKTKASLKTLLLTGHYLLSAVFWLVDVGNPCLREVKHGREDS